MTQVQSYARSPAPYSHNSEYDTSTEHSSDIRRCTVRRWDDYPGFGLHLSRTAGNAGVVISEVEQGSPASACGLLPGDRVIEINGIEVETKPFVDILQILQNELKHEEVEFLVASASTPTGIDYKHVAVVQRETPRRGTRTKDQDGKRSDAMMIASLVGKATGESWENIVDNVNQNYEKLNPRPLADDAVVATSTELDNEFKEALRSMTKNQEGETFKADPDFQRLMVASKRRSYRSTPVVIEKQSGETGIGISVSPDPDIGHIISEVAPGSPADKANIKRGDVIIQIGDDVVLHLPYKKLVSRLQSMTGNRVFLSVAPKDMIMRCALEHVPILTQYDTGNAVEQVLSRGQTVASHQFQREESVRQPYQPEPARPSRQPETTRPSYPPEPTRPSYQPEPATPSQQPETTRRSYQPEPTRPSYEPETTRPSYQPEPTRPSYQPEPATPSYQPEPTRPSYLEPEPSLRPQEPEHPGERPPSTAEFVPPPISQPPSEPSRVSAMSRPSPSVETQSRVPAAPQVPAQPTAPPAYQPAYPAPTISQKPALSPEERRGPEASLPPATKVAVPSIDVSAHKTVKIDGPNPDGILGFDVETRGPGEHVVIRVSPALKEAELGVGDRIMDMNGTDATKLSNQQLITEARDMLRKGPLVLIVLSPPLEAPALPAGARHITIHKEKSKPVGFQLKTLNQEGRNERIHAFGDIVPGMAADVAGVREGDKIIRLNGVDVSNLSHQEVLALLKQDVPKIEVDVIEDDIVRASLRDAGSGSDIRKDVPQPPSKTTPTAKEPGLLTFSIAVDSNVPSIGLRLTKDMVIQSAEPTGAAAKAGLQKGDVVVRINGAPVSSAEHQQAFHALRQAIASGHVELTVDRKATQATADSVSSVTRRDPSPAVATPRPQSVDKQSQMTQEKPPIGLGSPQAARPTPERNTIPPPAEKQPVPRPPSYQQEVPRIAMVTGLVVGSPIGISLKDNKGRPAEVTKVTPGSPADKAGLHVGDYLLKINGKDVESSKFADIKAMISSCVPSGSMQLEVINERFYPEYKAAPEEHTPVSITVQNVEIPDEYNQVKFRENKETKDGRIVSNKDSLEMAETKGSDTTMAAKDTDSDRKSSFSKLRSSLTRRKLSLSGRGKGYKKCVMPTSSTASQIGFTLVGSSEVNGIFYCTEVVNDSAAQLSGMENGDMIVDINVKSLKTMKMMDVISWIRKVQEREQFLSIGTISKAFLKSDEKWRNLQDLSGNRKLIKRAQLSCLEDRFNLKEPL